MSGQKDLDLAAHESHFNRQNGFLHSLITNRLPVKPLKETSTMIADPMADLGGAPPGMGGTDGDGPSGTKEVIDPMAMAMNMARIDRMKNVMGIVAGCVAGISGLTGIAGFVFFILWHVMVCSVIWATKMDFNLSVYTRQTWFTYITMGAQQFALSFTLFWTLFYGLVYLY